MAMPMAMAMANPCRTFGPAFFMWAAAIEKFTRFVSFRFVSFHFVWFGFIFIYFTDS